MVEFAQRMLTKRPTVARISETVTTQVRSLDFVDAARASGAGTWAILRVHVLGNVLGPVFVYATGLISVSVELEPLSPGAILLLVMTPSMMPRSISTALTVHCQPAMMIVLHRYVHLTVLHRSDALYSVAVVAAAVSA